MGFTVGGLFPDGYLFCGNSAIYKIVLSALLFSGVLIEGSMETYPETGSGRLVQTSRDSSIFVQKSYAIAPLLSNALTKNVDRCFG